ncbi:CobW family GTP-binding protein [Macrococcoides caseolyticum]|uniref:CobW family GTP-binding protein n=1 Tax=Macrococcoides caseolyticum TaxID=69966 RepID=UPI001F30D669|nr:GTP-binding protein [Macrococcus caseolyticus]MCE4955902.1 GTP-binding protein [Macrococcus caseolyticus]
MKQQKMKLLIISGFLGSGKTTLLSQMIKQNKNQKIAILMNELGGFNVDSKILGEDTPYNELLNGCICCDLKSDVAVQMNDLYHRHHPDIVIIEATGVAHPVEIYDACTDPVVTQIADVLNITTILDCARFLNRHQYSDTTRRLMEEQVKYAHIILLNKVDLVSKDDLLKLTDCIKVLNPNALCIETSYCEVTQNILDYTGETITEHRHMHHGIQSLVYEFKGAIDARQFVAWLRLLPDNILRVKGFIKFRENPEQVVLFQYAYGVPQYEEEMMNLPLKLVIIGESLDKQQLFNQLDVLQFG